MFHSRKGNGPDSLLIGGGALTTGGYSRSRRRDFIKPDVDGVLQFCRATAEEVL